MTVDVRDPQTGFESDHAAACDECGAPLADDQRYCLNCGTRARSAGPRFGALPAYGPASERESPTGPPRWTERPLTTGAAAAGLGVLALVLIAGVLIGGAGGDDSKVVASSPPQVITVAGAGAATPAAEQSFTSDWTEGETGYTIELQTLPNDSPVADVEAAKKAASDKGAPEVGALSSDDFSSLDSGNYVIYSGVFAKRGAAARALKKLKNDFPDARIVKVDNGNAGGGGGATRKEKTVDKKELKNLEKLSPQEYQKKSKKLPDKLKLPGKAPPKDNKKPGGGGGGETIG
jgi:hypothetical protein